MNKKLITSAVASAVALPTAAFAAIDDQGMAYVTAAEGLHGSLRMFLIDTTSSDDVQERDASTNTSSLRMWVNGSADLGGGLQSTYYWEFRGNEGGGTDVQSNAWDIGLKGAFGEVEFGKLAMSSFRLVPSASLAYEEGSQRESPGADTKDHGWRYESPVINGFQFGVSGILNGSKTLNAGNPDGSLDEYALALKYTMPIGLEVGGAYESVKNHGNQVLTTLTLEKEDSQGYRFGMRYGQDNWLIAYEYRTYDSYVPKDFTSFSGYIDDRGGILAEVQLATSLTLTDVSFGSGEQNVDYNVHAFGVQVKIDRITMSANYSTDEVEMMLDTTGGDALSKSKYTKERDVIAVDAAYALGSRANIAVGWVKLEGTDETDSGIEATQTQSNAFVKGDVSRTYVFYRVDF